VLRATSELIGGPRDPRGLKEITNQVVGFTKATYVELYPLDSYYVVEKTDGVRGLLVTGQRPYVITSERVIELKPTGAAAGSVVVDVELVEIDGVVNYFAFDVLVYDRVTTSDPFEKRLGALEAAAGAVANAVAAPTHAKKYHKFSREAVKAVYTAKYPYEIDGLILVKPGDNYANTLSYKWKPAEHNTIDFLVIKSPITGLKPYLAREGKTLYILMVGINARMQANLGIRSIPQITASLEARGIGQSEYRPIHFCPSFNPYAHIYYGPEGLDGKIVELLLEGVEPCDNMGCVYVPMWKFVRERTDRSAEKQYWGNDFRVAEINYLNYVDPFTIDDLTSPPTGYFTKTSPAEYTSAHKYKRFVTSMLMKKYFSGAKWIIDEAAGRGGDLHRYAELGVAAGLFIEIDQTALAELVRRKFEAMKSRGKGKYPSAHPMVIHTMCADLKTEYEQLIIRAVSYGIGLGEADGIMCNFAFHYLCGSFAPIKNILSFNSAMLRVGGMFVFTVLDGARVFAALSGREMVEWHEGDRRKYAIEKRYRGTKLENAGQTIAVLLPFADSFVEEPLCNVEYVVEVAKKTGFELVESHPMGHMLDEFSHILKKDPRMAALTPVDLEYIALHQYVVLRKIKTISGGRIKALKDKKIR
jgi:hypothetical protein